MLIFLNKESSSRSLWNRTPAWKHRTTIPGSIWTRTPRCLWMERVGWSVVEKNYSTRACEWNVIGTITQAKIILGTLGRRPNVMRRRVRITIELVIVDARRVFRFLLNPWRVAWNIYGNSIKPRAQARNNFSYLRNDIFPRGKTHL